MYLHFIGRYCILTVCCIFNINSAFVKYYHGLDDVSLI